MRRDAPLVVAAALSAALVGALLAAILALGACPRAAARCNTDQDCFVGNRCVDGACAPDPVGPVDGGTHTVDAGSRADAGRADDDAGAPVDAGPDAGNVDAGFAADAGSVDAGFATDAGFVDAGTIADAGFDDAGNSSGVDAGPPPPVPFELWGLNEPNDITGTEDCMEMRLTPNASDHPGEWNDADCTLAQPFVCAPQPMPPPADPSGCALDAGGRLFCDNPSTFADARAFCASLGTDLAFPVDVADSTSIFNEAKALFTGPSGFWLGASDLNAEKAWRFVDGSSIPTPFSHWDIGAPNGGTGANCLRMVLVSSVNGTPGDWNDLVCSTSLPFACDVPGGTVAAGCVVVVEGPKTRMFCPLAVPATTAAAKCAERNGLLSEIDSAAENVVFATDAQTALSNAGDVWIGGSDQAVEGTWRWADGNFFDQF